MKPFSLEEYLANPSKKVITRDGRTVKIYCTDYIDKCSRSVIAKIEGNAYSYSFREDGRFVDHKETDNDLFFATEKHEGWINIYRDPYTGETSFGVISYNSRKEAEDIGKSDDYYVATGKFEWEE